MKRRLSILCHTAFLSGCAVVLVHEGHSAWTSLDCLLGGPYRGGPPLALAGFAAAESDEGRRPDPDAPLSLAQLDAR